MLARDERQPESRPSLPRTWAIYRGPVTARVAGRGITLDNAGDHGTELDDWVLAILGLDAYAGGRARARIVAELIELRDPADSPAQERLRLLGVHADQRPANGGAADVLIRALAAYAIPGEVHPETAVTWAIADDPALDGRSPVVWADGGGNPDRLLTIARQDGARMAG